MARDYDSSVVSSNERSGSSSDDEVIMVKRKQPKIIGLNASVYLYVFVMTLLLVGVMHMQLVVYLSAIRYGWIMTVMFGLLGPISVMFWILAVTFTTQAFRVLLTHVDDYRGSANMFRRWARTSRLMIVTFIGTMTQFIFGCFMFVTATSMEHTAYEILKQRRTPPGWFPSMVLAFAELYDILISVNYNVLYQYPLNLIAKTGRHWASTSLLIFVVPLAIMLVGVQAQIKYYDWKFGRLGIEID